MIDIGFLLNHTLNRIHDWGDAEQPPMKRMFLTRISGIACGIVEAAGIAASSCRLSVLATRELARLLSRPMQAAFPASKCLRSYSQHPSCFEETSTTFLTLCKRVAGLASTLFFGVVFSPELNFRLHIKLGLAIDTLAVKKQKELLAKLRVQEKTAEINKARAERFAKFEAERRVIKEELAIDSRLAELSTVST